MGRSSFTIALAVSFLFACSSDPESEVGSDAGTDMAAGDQGADISSSDPADLSSSDPNDSGPADMGADTTPDMDVVSYTAAERTVWFKGLVEAGTPLSPDEYEAAFSSGFRAEWSTPDFVNSVIADWHENRLPIGLVFDNEEELQVVGRLQAGDGTFWRLRLSVTAESPNPIDTVGLGIAADLNPSRAAPISPDEMFATLTNSQNQPLTGARVELYDRPTGQPFVPPAVAVTDAYGFVRLTVPPGATEVALHGTAADGLQTLMYHKHFRAGADVREQFIDRGLLTQAAAAAGVALDDTKGTLLVANLWEPAGNPFIRLPVGCATMSTVPAETELHYASPTTNPTTNGFPDPSRNDTNPLWSTAWFFNAEPTAHDVTVVGGAAEANVSIPTVLADGWTVAYAYFTTPTHPTVDTCYTRLTALSCDEEGSLLSARGNQQTLLHIRNESSRTVELRWLDFQGDPQLYGVLAPGDTVFQPTYLGHHWLIRNVASGTCDGIYTAGADPGIIVIE